LLKITYGDRVKLKQVLTKNYNNLGEAYKSLNSKYVGLQRRLYSESQFKLGAGIDSGPSMIINPNAGANVLPNMAYNWGNLINDTSGKLISRPATMDFGNMFSEKCFVINLSDSLSIAEFLIKEKLGNVFYAGATGMANMTPGNGTVLNNNFDMHDTGAVATLSTLSKVFHGFHTCIHEFVSVLKSSGDWDKTLIQIGGDFTRTPNPSDLALKGSGHGYDGDAVTFISGRIKAPMVLGNIQKDPYYKNSSWGLSAPHDELSGQPIRTPNILSTACALIGIESPMPSYMPLVQFDSSGNLVKKIGAKNV